MTYVYILRSMESPERYYVRITADLPTRLAKHNAGEVWHTSKYAPWTVKTYVAFSDEKQAIAFETYMKFQDRDSNLCCLGSKPVAQQLDLKLVPIGDELARVGRVVAAVVAL